MLQGIKVQHIKNIVIRLIPLLPLRHLDRAQIMRRIHITMLITPRDLPAEVKGQGMLRQLFDIIERSRRATEASVGVPLLLGAEEPVYGAAAVAVPLEVSSQTAGQLDGIGEGWDGRVGRGTRLRRSG